MMSMLRGGATLGNRRPSGNEHQPAARPCAWL